MNLSGPDSNSYKVEKNPGVSKKRPDDQKRSKKLFSFKTIVIIVKKKKEKKHIISTSCLIFSRVGRGWFCHGSRMPSKSVIKGSNSAGASLMEVHVL